MAFPVGGPGTWVVDVVGRVRGPWVGAGAWAEVADGSRPQRIPTHPVSLRGPLARPTAQALKPGAATLLDATTLEAVAGDAPSATLARAEVEGRTLVDVMVAVGLQLSKGAARK
jgi:hypothetical protein